MYAWCSSCDVRLWNDVRHIVWRTQNESQRLLNISWLSLAIISYINHFQAINKITHNSTQQLRMYIKHNLRVWHISNINVILILSIWLSLAIISYINHFQAINKITHNSTQLRMYIKHNLHVRHTSNINVILILSICRTWKITATITSHSETMCIKGNGRLD
jgi:hypothetical protein